MERSSAICHLRFLFLFCFRLWFLCSDKADFIAMLPLPPGNPFDPPHKNQTRNRTKTRMETLTWFVPRAAFSFVRFCFAFRLFMVCCDLCWVFNENHIKSICSNPRSSPCLPSAIHQATMRRGVAVAHQERVANSSQRSLCSCRQQSPVCAFVPVSWLDPPPPP